MQHTSHRSSRATHKALHTCTPYVYCTFFAPICAKRCVEAHSSGRLRQLFPQLELQEAIPALDADDAFVDPPDPPFLAPGYDGLSGSEAELAAAGPSAAVDTTTSPAPYGEGHQAAPPQFSSYSGIFPDWTESDDVDIQLAELQLGQVDLTVAGITDAVTAALQTEAGWNSSFAMTMQTSGQHAIWQAPQPAGWYLQGAPRLQQEQQLLQELAGAFWDHNSNSSSSSSIISISSRAPHMDSPPPQPIDSSADLALVPATAAAAAAAAAKAAAAAAAGAANELLPSNTAAVVAEATTSAQFPGSFFPSRARMLQQLKQKQRLVQRQQLLHKQRRSLYTYTLSGSGSIVRVPAPGPKSPLKQDMFPLAKRPTMQQQQQQRQQSGDVEAAAAAKMQSNRSMAEVGSSRSAGNGSMQGGQDAPVLQQQQQQQQLQQLQQLYPLQPDELMPELEQNPRAHQYISGSSSSSSSAGGAGSTGSTGNVNADPSRGLCLSAFLYCCSRSKLLSLTWQLGLPPAALVFVPRVADADLVLHVKPGKGQRHYEYDEYRAQAAAKGIPFVDLKNLSLAELQLYLLPIYKLYAGEVSPRELLLRKQPRGRRKRYTNIKLPPA